MKLIKSISVPRFTIELYLDYEGFRVICNMAYDREMNSDKFFMDFKTANHVFNQTLQEVEGF